MNLRPPLLQTLVVAVATVLSATESRSAVLISNLPDTYSGFSTVGNTAALAVSFRTPSVAYSVDSVTLSLSSYSTTGGDVAAVGFYTDNGGVPGTLVTTLLNNPASSSTAVASFTFTAPSGGISLSPDTTYFLQVDRLQGSFRWNIGGGTPPSGLATFGAYVTFDRPTSTWTSSSSVKLFSIEATSVPEPQGFTAALAAGLLGLGLWRQVRGCF